MLELKPGLSPVVKVAEKLKDYGYYVITSEGTATISLDKASLDSFCVIVSINRNLKPQLSANCEYEIIVLTDISDKQRYIIERNDAIYLSSYLETDNICEMVKYLLNSKNQKSKTRKRISQQLLYLGLEPHFNGYTYLKAIITMMLEDPDLQHKPVMYLYDLIAESYEANVCSVERAIRNAIENAYYQHKMRFKEFFGSCPTKPHNYKFIATTVEHIKLII